MCITTAPQSDCCRSQLRLQELLTLPSLVLLYKLMDTISVQTQQLQLYQAEMMASLEQKPNPWYVVPPVLRLRFQQH